jgi:hypothetical protein
MRPLVSGWQRNRMLLAAGPYHAYQRSGEPSAFSAYAEVSAGIQDEQAVHGAETHTLTS